MICLNCLLTQGIVLDETTAKNVHILDQTLFLSSVSKENSGDYVCTVTNQAGSGRSNVMEIRVPGELWSDLIDLPLVSQSFCCCSYRQYLSN